MISGRLKSNSALIELDSLKGVTWYMKWSIIWYIVWCIRCDSLFGMWHGKWLMAIGRFYLGSVASSNGSFACSFSSSFFCSFFFLSGLFQCNYLYFSWLRATLFTCFTALVNTSAHRPLTATWVSISLLPRSYFFQFPQIFYMNFVENSIVVLGWWFIFFLQLWERFILRFRVASQLDARRVRTPMPTPWYNWLSRHFSNLFRWIWKKKKRTLLKIMLSIFQYN